MAKKESVKAPANEPANNPNILRVPAWEGGRSQEALWAEIAYLGGMMAKKESVEGTCQRAGKQSEHFARSCVGGRQESRSFMG